MCSMQQCAVLYSAVFKHIYTCWTRFETLARGFGKRVGNREIGIPAHQTRAWIENQMHQTVLTMRIFIAWMVVFTFCFCFIFIALIVVAMEMIVVCCYAADAVNFIVLRSVSLRLPSYVPAYCHTIAVLPHTHPPIGTHTYQTWSTKTFPFSPNIFNHGFHDVFYVFNIMYKYTHTRMCCFTAYSNPRGLFHSSPFCCCCCSNGVICCCYRQQK